jgi:hypothetical protein
VSAKDSIGLFGHITVNLLLLLNLVTVTMHVGDPGLSGVILYYILVALTAGSITMTIAKVRSLK